MICELIKTVIVILLIIFFFKKNTIKRFWGWLYRTIIKSGRFVFHTLWKFFVYIMKKLIWIIPRLLKWLVVFIRELIRFLYEAVSSLISILTSWGQGGGRFKRGGFPLFCQGFCRHKESYWLCKNWNEIHNFCLPEHMWRKIQTNAKHSTQLLSIDNNWWPKQKSA